jgi:Mg2+ and Co2+ transporter CorA
MPEEKTPVFIWIIVAIGAVLTIAVIVLIIRTRRVV